MRFEVRQVMNLALMLITAGVVISALDWPLKASLFPMVVAIPVFFMALGDLVLNLREGTKKHDKAVIDFKFSQDTDKGPARRRTLLTFCWIIAFFFMVLLLGFPASVPLFVFSYLKFQAKESWPMTLIITAAFWGSFWGLFTWLLNTRFPSGLLFRGLHILGVL